MPAAPICFITVPIATATTDAYHAKIKAEPAPYKIDNRTATARTFKLFSKIASVKSKVPMPDPEFTMLIVFICVENSFPATLSGRITYQKVNDNNKPRKRKMKKGIDCL